MGENYQHGYRDYPVFAFSENYPHGHTETWHHHQYIQLIHTLTGVIRIQTEEGIWITPPHRGMWIPAGKKHALVVSGEVKVRGVFIDASIQLHLADHCQVVTVSPLLKELINSAMQIQTRILPHSRNERIMHLILDEIQLLSELPFNLPEPNNPKLQQLCEYIKMNLSHSWDIEATAASIHMSSKTFARHFQKETGLHFSHWLRQAKLMQAMIDLALNIPILDVALSLGYNSPSAFSAMFKREMGLTPSDYLQQINTD